jgi:hypothetical protein
MHKTKTNCPDDFTKNISAASNHTFTSSLVHLKFHLQGVLTKKKKKKKERGIGNYTRNFKQLEINKLRKMLRLSMKN